MGFLMALRVNTFHSCQSVAQILQTVQQAENHVSLRTFDVFCFLLPIFGHGVRPPTRSLHVLIYWLVFIISVMVKIWTVVGCGH